MNNNHFVDISFLFLTKNPTDLGFFVKKRTLNLHYATTDVCANNLLTSARLTLISETVIFLCLLLCSEVSLVFVFTAFHKNKLLRRITVFHKCGFQPLGMVIIKF